MRRTKEQMLLELQAKIAEDKTRASAREIARLVGAALIKRDYPTAHSLGLDLIAKTGELAAIDPNDQRRPADNMEAPDDRLF